jgi:hypothetical protein
MKLTSKLLMSAAKKRISITPDMLELLKRVWDNPNIKPTDISKIPHAAKTLKALMGKDLLKLNGQYLYEVTDRGFDLLTQTPRWSGDTVDVYNNKVQVWNLVDMGDHFEPFSAEATVPQVNQRKDLPAEKERRTFYDPALPKDGSDKTAAPGDQYPPEYGGEEDDSDDSEEDQVIKRALNLKGEDFVEFIKDLDPEDLGLCSNDTKNLYLERLSENSASLKPLCPDHGIVKALCPSELESEEVIGGSTGMHFPTDVMIENWSVDDLIDEYFGQCYNQDRDGGRFERGFKKAIAARLPQLSPDLRTLFNTGIMTDLSELYAGLATKEDMYLIFKGYGMDPSLEYNPEDVRDWLTTKGFNEHMDTQLEELLKGAEEA